MESIVEFVLEGMRPETNVQILEIVMRLPLYASRADWHSIYLWVSAREMMAGRDIQTIKEFAWWLLSPSGPRQSWCICVGLLQKVPSLQRMQFKNVFALCYSVIFDAQAMIKAVLDSLVVKNRPIRGKLQLLWERHWAFRGESRPANADVRLAFVLMHCWALGRNLELASVWQMMDTEREARLFVEYLRCARGGVSMINYLKGQKHLVFSDEQLQRLFVLIN